MKPLYVTLCLAGLAAPVLAAPVTLQNATATFSQAGFPISATLDGTQGIGVANGWALNPQILDQTAAYETSADVVGALGTAFTFTLTQNFGGSHTVGRFRLSVTSDARATFADGLQSGGDVTASWTQLTPLTALATNGALLDIQGDNSVLALHGGLNPNPPGSVYTITATTAQDNITGIRLEVLEHVSLPFSGPGRQPTNGNFVLQELQVDAVALVPEPASAALVMLGAATLLRRRR
jgi:hypothetical protein